LAIFKLLKTRQWLWW